MVVNRRIFSRFGVSCYTVIDMSLMRRFLDILSFCFRAIAIILIWRLKRRRVSFHLFVFSVAATFWRFYTGHFVIPGSCRAWWGFGVIVKRWYCINWLLRRISRTVLRFFHFNIFLRLARIAVGAMSGLKASILYVSPSAAALVAKNIATRASSLLSVTFFRSKSSITCSTTLYMLNLLPLHVLLNDVLIMSPRDSHTVIATSFVVIS